LEFAFPDASFPGGYGGEVVRVVLDAARFAAGGFSLSADAVFSACPHLISGRIGSGKSTLASALAGLSRPNFGKVVLDGCASPVLLMQFPEYQVTGASLSAEAASWGVLGTEPVFSRLDAKTGGRDPFSLSRGELKRLMLACVFAGDPDVLVLDEPYASLDPEAKGVLTELIEGRRGITVIFSHETEFAPRNAVKWRIKDGGLVRE